LSGATKLQEARADLEWYRAQLGIEATAKHEARAECEKLREELARRDEKLRSLLDYAEDAELIPRECVEALLATPPAAGGVAEVRRELAAARVEPAHLAAVAARVRHEINVWEEAVRSFGELSVPLIAPQDALALCAAADQCAKLQEELAAIKKLDDPHACSYRAGRHQGQVRAG
jgi:hypothetical protein